MKKILHEALDAAFKIERRNFSARYYALNDVVNGMIKAMMFNEARKVLDEAFDAAREMCKTWNYNDRYNIFTGIADNMIKTGMFDEASKPLHETINISPPDRKYYNWSSVFLSVAKRLVRSQHYRQARLVANECSDLDDRLDAYTVVLIEYLKEKKPNLRQQLEAIYEE